MVNTAVGGRGEGFPEGHGGVGDETIDTPILSVFLLTLCISLNLQEMALQSYPFWSLWLWIQAILHQNSNTVYQFHTITSKGSAIGRTAFLLRPINPHYFEIKTAQTVKIPCETVPSPLSLRPHKSFETLNPETPISDP